MPASAGLLAPGPISSRPLFKDRLNVVPLPYRGVSVQAYHGPLTADGIASQFLGRETYRRTEFIVLKAPDGAHAVIAVDAVDREPLFAPIEHVEVLALPDTCFYVRDPQTDCANRSALAALAAHTASGRTGPSSARESTITSISSIIQVPLSSRSWKSLRLSLRNFSIWSATF